MTTFIFMAMIGVLGLACGLIALDIANWFKKSPRGFPVKPAQQNNKR